MANPADPIPRPVRASTDDSVFLERAMRYLEDALPIEELPAFEAELLNSAEKRRSLTMICLSDSLAFEEITPRSVRTSMGLTADVPIAPSTDELAAVSLTLQESMTLPALIAEPDEPDESLQLSEFVAAPAVRRRERRHLVRWIGIAACVGFAALGTMLLMQFTRPTVATLVGEVDAKWAMAGRYPGKTFSSGSELALERGYATILFEDGTELTAEAPSQFRLTSERELELLSGSIVAKMAAGHSGFTVRFATGVAKDLGTEFGVKYDQRTKQADVHVFHGVVRVASEQGSGGQYELRQGDAAAIGHDLVTVRPGGAVPQSFVRNLIESPVASLDLSDLIAGGDGTTKLTGTGIEPATGEVGALSPAPAHGSDGIYHLIVSRPVLDGCFVPRLKSQIDSTGRTMQFATGIEQTFDRIYVGGTIPSVMSHPIYSELAGVDYATGAHRLFFIHPNAGLTLNLDAIRRLHPAARLARLLAVVGNSNLEPQAEQVRPQLQILADGQERFNHVFHGHADIVRLDLPINDTDRFLTVVATDTGNTMFAEDLVFGDPVFDMAPKK